MSHGRGEGRTPLAAVAGEPPEGVLLVRDEDALGELAARCAKAPRLAVDVEADGLFSYRAALCAVQLAFEEDGAGIVAIVDTLATSVRPLAAVLGPGGPIKVLHDLTFDARLLAEQGAPLERVRDTSVAARLLGATATGLAALLGELGVHVDKRFQQHDWSRRPLTTEQLVYLAGDVRHLLALDDHLAARAAALGIAAEIADECAYKLWAAGLPVRDARPGYARVKGIAGLDGPGRAVLRRLVAAREAAAAEANVPPFKIVTSEVLLELARRRPLAASGVRAVAGAASGRAARLVPTWLEAIVEGLRDGDLPPDELAALAPRRVDRAELARRRARESQISAWRRAEARARGVDEQAVLPGHCAQELADVMLAHAPDDPALAAGIRAITGLGEARLRRYGDALVELARTPPEEKPRAAPEPVAGPPA